MRSWRLRSTWIMVGISFGLLGLTIGCGSSLPPTGEISGTVTTDGKPVTAGTVKFFPEKGDPVVASLGADGTYRATGIPLGKARISIETVEFKNLTPPPPGMAKQMSGPRTKYVPIPAKYEKPESSELSIEVEKGTKTFDINCQ